MNGDCPQGCPCDYPTVDCDTEVDMLVITPGNLVSSYNLINFYLGYYNGPPNAKATREQKPIEQHLLKWSS